MLNFRIGHGFDVHAFSKDKKPLILGGIEVHKTMGLVAHSDGDVILHSLTDALLGSVSMGDIGRHFPDNDNKYKNKDSSFFVKKALSFIKNKGFCISNIDITVQAEAPKLALHIDKMVLNISNILEIDKDNINIKATTTEKLGFIGRKEGIAVDAVVLIMKY